MKAIYLPLFFSGFRDFLNHPSRLAASGANLFFYHEIMLRNFYFMRFGAILFYALRRNYYCMRFDTIIILCASAQFYAKAIFVIGRLLPR